MLSPFFAHILEHVTLFKHYVIDSKSKDAGTFNQVGSYLQSGLKWTFGAAPTISRNEQLSTVQQQKATELYELVTRTDPKDMQDGMFCETLKKKVDKAIGEVRAAVTRAKSPDQTSWLLLELQLFQKRILTAEQYFKGNQLFDQPVNATPLVVFQTGLSNYLINKAVYLHALELGYYSKTGQIRSWLYDKTLSARKETIVKGYLSKEYDPHSTREDILPFIRDVLQQDKDLIDRQRVETSLSVGGVSTLKVDVPLTLIYNPKTLTDEMRAALNILGLERYTSVPLTYAANNSISGGSSIRSRVQNDTEETPAPPLKEIVIPEPVIEAVSASNNNNDDDFDTVEKYYSGDDDEDSHAIVKAESPNQSVTGLPRPSSSQ